MWNRNLAGWVRLWGTLAIVFICESLDVRGGELAPLSYGQPRRLGTLANEQIGESSGLAISYRHPGLFWTHNDSGDVPRVFAFDETGRHRAEVQVAGASSIDWEDMASFEHGGRSWLLLADVGDNRAKRMHCTLYLCGEPGAEARETAATAFSFRYEDGPHDCEGVAVDGLTREVLLVSKIYGVSCNVYSLQLPDAATRDEMAVARKIASIPVPVATGMDISPDRQRAVVLTYTDAYLFERSENENWGKAFERNPRRITLPVRRQGEAICFGPDSQTLYLTSEHIPAPFWQLAPRK